MTDHAQSPQQLISSTSACSIACCEFFIEILNHSFINLNKASTTFPPDSSNNSISNNENIQIHEKVAGYFLTPNDITSFLSYCQIWQIKQCVCVFTNDDLIEKFHHFLHNIISTSIDVIQNLTEDYCQSLEDSINQNSARRWSSDEKEKLLMALVKTFSLSMPLYVTYKHLLFNQGRYTRMKECSCSWLSNDSLALLQLFCHSSSQNVNQRIQDYDNLPIELLRNISHFIDLNGLNAIKICFSKSTSDNLPLKISHVLFNIIVNTRLWLNMSVIQQKILPIRSLAVQYMCQLSEKDLRLVGTKNTTELMYESFKELNSYDSYDQTNSINQKYEIFKLDRDGLALSLKYFMCSTLTIRLCGIVQMNLQINAWNEYNSLTSRDYKTDSVSSEDNELADWFVKNKIIETLYGPNLHVEVVKRSQDIMNFLAITNRLSHDHFNVIWSSAQLKHCSKSIMDMLMALHKHLNIESIKYLSSLIAKLNLLKHTEQTLSLSALLTKNIWFTMLDVGNKKRKKTINTNEDDLINVNDKNRVQQYRNILKEKQLKIRILNYQKSNKQVLVSKSNLKKQQQALRPNHFDANIDDGDSINFNHSKRAYQDEFDDRNVNFSTTDDEDTEENGVDDNPINILNNEKITVQKITNRNNHSMETQINTSENEHSYDFKNKSNLNEDEESTNDENDEVLDSDDETEEDDSEEENQNEGEENDDPMNNEGINKVFLNSKAPFEMHSKKSSKFDFNRKNCLHSAAIKNLDEKKFRVNLIDELISSSTESSLRHSSSQASLSAVVSDEEDEENEENGEEDCDDDDNLDLLKQSYLRKQIKDEHNKKKFIDKSKIIKLINLSPKNRFSSDENTIKDIHDMNKNSESKKIGVLNECSENQSLLENFNENISKSFNTKRKNQVEKVSSYLNEEALSKMNESKNHVDAVDEIEADFKAFVNHDGVDSDENAEMKEEAGKNYSDDACIEIQLNLDSICSNGHTFLWDLLVSHSSLDEDATSEFNLKSSPVYLDDSVYVYESDLITKNSQVRSSFNQYEKILLEAEKQLQTLLCLPSTDMRIRVKFIESCLQNLRLNKACLFSLRLLIKLFSSFQQYSTSTSSIQISSSQNSKFLNLSKSSQSTISQAQRKLIMSQSGHQNTPSNIVEVHRIVAFTEHNHAMMDIFFENLENFTREKIAKINSIIQSHSKLNSFTDDKNTYSDSTVHSSEQDKLSILNQTRSNVQTRLQFLSFVYSTLGSPRDFELTRKHVEILWDCLTQFNDLNISSDITVFVSIRDDLFNWFLNQAKNKDQHAINIDIFKLIFINKIPHLNPNNFSQTALHLYQELFKIYKYSFRQQQQDFLSESGVPEANLVNFKQIELSAIEYIWKLAFKSSNKDVSLAAIQFLNSHYIQHDMITSVENEEQFIQNCMKYINEASERLQKIENLNLNEENLALELDQHFTRIELGLLLLKNHCQSFQNRHSFQLCQWQLRHQDTSEQLINIEKAQSGVFFSHYKVLEQIRTRSNELFNGVFKKTNTIVNNLAAKSSREDFFNHKNNINLLNVNPESLGTFDIKQNNFLTLICHINQSQFKFSLKISSSKYIGDLRAIIRKIILTMLKSTTAEKKLDKLDCTNFADQFTFINDRLTALNSNSKNTFANLNSNMSADLICLFKSIVENEDDFYLKIFNNGQELTSQSQTGSMILDAKQLSEIGLKDMQTIHVTLFSRMNNNGNGKNDTFLKLTENCIPMLILTKENNFNNLFDLLNLVSTFNEKVLKSLKVNESYALIEKSELLSLKLWEILVLLPTNSTYYRSISIKPGWYLGNLTDQLIGVDSTVFDDDKDHLFLNSKHNDYCSPYKMLYYLQIIEIIHQNLIRNRMNVDSNRIDKMKFADEKNSWLVKIYHLLIAITKNLTKANQNMDVFKQIFKNKSLSASDVPKDIPATIPPNSSSIVLLECLLIILRLLYNFLYTENPNYEPSKPSLNENAEHSSDECQNNNDISYDETPCKKPKRDLKVENADILNNSRISNAKFDWTYALNWRLFHKIIEIKDHNMDTTGENNSTERINLFLKIIFDIQTLVASLPPPNNNMSIQKTNENMRIEILFYTMQLMTMIILDTGNATYGINGSNTIELMKDFITVETCGKNWLRMLLLIENRNTQFRREASFWLYRICVLEQYRYSDINKKNRNLCLLDIVFKELLSLIDMTIKLKPSDNEYLNCKDYFTLISNLILNLNIVSDKTILKGLEVIKPIKLIKMDDLMFYIANELKNRDFYEITNSNGFYIEDDVLIGLFSLALSILRYHQSYAIQNDSQMNKLNIGFFEESCFEFLNELFDYMFKITYRTNSNDDYKIARLPKCRAVQTRALCFDLITELCRSNLKNYKFFNEKLIYLNKSLTTTVSPFPISPDSMELTQTYSWDYWPRDDSRSPCGYVGLKNLGATCYMATAMQHLFSIKEVRYCILRSESLAEQTNKSEKTDLTESNRTKSTNDKILMELKRMFAFLQESERKAFNPKEFCKFYTMDQQPLNTTEQKDMQEFFTDLISKLEETSNTELKDLIKKLFGGVITNLVISLDCPHVSCTLEEFYTIRCQVAGMKDLYDSLNEITVKDTLDGDNMYTCSKCSRKVRAEKRACFRQLPQILCFNTMRYTFNMITMLKEKVNTHFSFPLLLNMSGYMEKNVKPSVSAVSTSSFEESSAPSVQSPSRNSPETINSETEESEDVEAESWFYELIGVTVHTGTAEGGHYYSFIRERNYENELENQEECKARWHLFNDAEVKPFDAKTQLASECFGGETTSKTYDSTSDKFMDLSFEKSNSAYMLFYEKKHLNKNSLKFESVHPIETIHPLSNDLMKSIRTDNMNFMNDKQILDHAYFNFMWQMCDYVPREIICGPDVNSMLQFTETSFILAVKLGMSFLLEVYVHARDKPNIIQWIELLIKYFNASKQACLWFISNLCDEYESSGFQWCSKIFFKCPNSALRHMFQRLFLVALNKVFKEDKKLTEKFIKFFLDLIDLKAHKNKMEIASTESHSKSQPTLLNNCKFNIRFMSEYFMLLFEFSRCGMEECLLLIKHGAIEKCSRFYLANRRPNTLKNSTEFDKNSRKRMKSSDVKIDLIDNTSKLVKDEILNKNSVKSIAKFEKKRGLAKKKRLKKTSTNEIDIYFTGDDLNNNSDTESLFNSSENSNSSSTSSIFSTSSQSDSSDSTLFLSSESSSSATSSNSIDEDVITVHDQKSKLKVFEKILALISQLSEKNAEHRHELHHCNLNETILEAEDFKILKKNQKLKLNFFYKAILDDINLNHVKIILFSLIRINNCCYSHTNPIKINKMSKKIHQFAERFVDMCCKSIKRIQEKNNTENDRSIAFFNMFGNNCMGLLETYNLPNMVSNEDLEEDEETHVKTGCSKCLECQENKLDFTLIIVDRLEYLLNSAPYHTLQWLASVCYANNKIQEWLLENMSLWVKPLLIHHKQTNIRFSAAILLANLIPNRNFRETFTSNRNMLVPFKNQNANSSLLNLASNSTSSSSIVSSYNQFSELNYEFDSEECKQVLHKIIKYLFSIMEDLGQYVGANEKNNINSKEKDGGAFPVTTENKLSSVGNRLVQYFTFLTYCMSSNDEKRLFSTYNQTMDKFWSLVYYPYIANNHVCMNLNKQVAVHFFYQALLNCNENIEHILEQTTVSIDTDSSTNTSDLTTMTKTKVVFTNKISRELPMCTVAVDHEDNDLISYNRQCLHPYYATIRILCQNSPLYTREMNTHSNFQWAFKHIMPYSNQYPNAVQELIKCVQLFIRQEGSKLSYQGIAKNKRNNIEIDKSNSESKANGSSNSNLTDESLRDKNQNVEITESGDDDEDEEDEEDGENNQLQLVISNFKENLANTFLMNQDIDTKQSWQSIIMVMKSLIETLEDGTLVLTRRGLSVLSICFFHISVLHQSNSGGSNINQTGLDSMQTYSNLNYDLCECMQILMQLCETVKHHLDKRTDGIRQIIQAWKEKNELCKRALMLVNFYNISEVRTRALELVRMILGVSPNETIQYVIQIIYASYTSNQSHIYMSYTSSTCNSNSLNSSGPSTSNMNLKNHHQCISSVQLISQAVHLMGPHFPINRKINLNQTSSLRSSKSIFNMIIPVMFVAHNHLNGAIILQNHQSQLNQNSQQHQTNLDYEKLLLDSYVPYLTFFDWLCRNAFNRRLTKINTDNSNNPSSSVSSTFPTLIQTTKQIIDLILIISQQSILLNVSFISYLNNFLTISIETNEDRDLIEDRPTINEFHQLIANSNHLNSFISTILNDYRYLLNKKEIYEFVQIMLPDFITNLKSEPGLTKPNSNGLKSTFLITLKSYIERCCQSINEIRFYFEFQQLSKHLIKHKTTNTLNECAATSSTSSFSARKNNNSTPNITNNLDFKSSQILGSIKAIYLLIASNIQPHTAHQSSSIPTSNSTNRSATSDDCSLFKFKLELKIYLVEIINYLQVQMTEMNKFLSDKSETPKEIVSDSNQSEVNKNNELVDNLRNNDNETNLEIEETADESETTLIESNSKSEIKYHRNKQNSTIKSKKHKPNEDEKITSPSSSTPTTSKEAIQNNHNNLAIDTIIRQVETKRKYLDHVIQVLNQTLNSLLNSLEASTHLIDLSSTNNSADSSATSSTVSSTASSPTHVSEGITIENSSK